MNKEPFLDVLLIEIISLLSSFSFSTDEFVKNNVDSQRYFNWSALKETRSLIGQHKIVVVKNHSCCRAMAVEKGGGK